MRQELFEARHAKEWQEFEQWLKLQKKLTKKIQSQPFHAQELPQRYRLLCQQLAIARDRSYSLSLIERLHQMVIKGHDIIYRSNNGLAKQFIAYVSGGFARDIRAAKYWLLLSTSLLMLPWLAVMVAIYFYPNFVFVIIDPEQVNSFESMYSQAQSSYSRVADDDWRMFGHYIYNNIGIAFRAFAGGLLAGLGTVATLLYNGLVLGALFARAETVNLTNNFYSFVSGHAAFEIGGIIVSGAAGLKLGWSILAPGNLPRGESLRRATRSMSGLIGGSAAMLFIAAILEAFWSPRVYPVSVKLTVGGVLLVLLILYFTFAGRRNAA